jgi:hypothetical protein
MRPSFSEIVEKFKRGEPNSPGCDDGAVLMFFQSSRRLRQPEVCVGPTDYVEKIRLPNSEAHVGPIDEASANGDREVAFMNAVILVTE